MKLSKYIFSLLSIWVFIPAFLFAQEAQNTETKPKKKFVKKTFENAVVMNNETVENPGNKTLDFIIQHRFGTIVDETDLFGLYASSNIRLGLSYGITDRIAVGVGATKLKRIYDLNWRVVLLRQTSGKGFGMPVTVTYFGDLARRAGSHTSFMNQDNKYKQSNRISYFHELMVARKITSHLSLQVAGTWSYYNILDTGMERSYLGLSFVGRYQFTPQSSLILEFDMPITQYGVTTTSVNSSTSVTEETKYFPRVNPGIGYEVATSGHQIQIFVSSATYIINQENRTFNQNDFTDKGLLIGFNITRQWGF